MEVKRCARCGGFHLTGNSICSKCQEKEMSDIKALEAQFAGLDKIDYAQIAEASKNTNISGERIERYLETYFKM